MIQLVIALWLALPATAQTSARVDCTLRPDGAGYRGTCLIPCAVNALAVGIDGNTPAAPCQEPARRVAAQLTRDGVGWRGSMEGKFPEDPPLFLLQGEVAKTPFGWFRLTAAEAGAEGLVLDIATDRQLPPTPDDLRIIRRARELVRSETVWDRQDDRVCRPNPGRWSVFCALMQATGEVSGGVHYRQPALQAVREVVNEVGGNRTDRHRLMDYNNHPETTLADIHALLAIAEARLLRDQR